MKILIYGSKGWIGGMFVDYLLTKKNEVVLDIVESPNRVDDEFMVYSDLVNHKPTHVISFIGRTHGVIDNEKVNTIDYLEYPGKLVENIRDNLFSPMILAIKCSELHIHYTYLGTGCIFNSENPDTFHNDPEMFHEHSLPNYYGSGYSVVKGFTDRLMKLFPVLNLRIRMPISSIPNERNFINKIINYKRICSIPNSMTVLDDFFPIFFDLMVKNRVGTYNCTNPGLIEHNEILGYYREIVDPEFTWENMTLSEQDKILKSSRSNNYLDTKLVSSEYPELKNITESINNILYKLKDQ